MMNIKISMSVAEGGKSLTASAEEKPNTTPREGLSVITYDDFIKTAQRAFDKALNKYMKDHWG